MQLLLLKYNNYYNRQLKGYATATQYKNAVGTANYRQFADINFNPRDGVNTYHTINTDFDFDYLVVLTDAGDIAGRWFAIDSVYSNSLQRRVTLRRDVLYDYQAVYGTVPAFIEKGAVSASDSAIYNLENMTFNQVLTSTSYLTDASNHGWVVGYLAKGRDQDYEVDISDSVVSNNMLTIPKNSRSCTDAPYDIIVIPPYAYKVSINGTVYENSVVGAIDPFTIAAKISKALTSGGVLYDIQYLPYCPFIRDSNWTISGTQMTSTKVTEGVDYAVSTATATQRKGIVLFAKSANISFKRTTTYDYDLSTALNVKIDNETRKYRILSPNSGTVFEFSPVKLGLRGTTNNIEINIKCTYKPYSPYIHIYPTFGGLYGSPREKENRGLICGGDFSLPLLNDAWSSYEIQNKNYMNAFNRQIENMEIHQDYERTQQVLNIASGAIGGAVGGATIGGVAGAAIGGIASVAGGIADYSMSEKLRIEALDYTKDMFGYNLQNIKALPVGLGRIGATVIDSFVHPVIEKYSATTEEVTALTNKIKWNGMTVGRIGTFNDFKSRASTLCRYIKAKIIRLADLHEELHTANAISEELYKGVYIY